MLRLIDKMESSKTVDSSVSMTSDVRPIAPNIIEPIETIYNGLQSDIDINDITSNFMSKEAVILGSEHVGDASVGVRIQRLF